MHPFYENVIMEANTQEDSPQIKEKIRPFFSTHVHLWLHCKLFVFTFFMFLASVSSESPGSSQVVFGNGRTHTGEVDGSGGSRLANYCLGASAS